MNNDEFMSMIEEADSDIQHYGVRGMRWRKGRKTPEKKASRPKTKKRAKIHGYSKVELFKRSRVGGLNRRHLKVNRKARIESKHQNKLQNREILRKVKVM